MTTIDMTSRIIWFTPSMIDGHACGSCTLLSTCHRPAPIDSAASIVVGGTSRIPSAVRRMPIGIAYAIDATIPGNRPTANSATTGTRYTNAGMTCIASSNGRMAASNRGLRPATIPTGTAIATASTTATSTCVNVSIVSYQMPDVSVGTWSPATTRGQ